LIPELAFLVALMVANGVFSGAEIAILSARRHRLETMAQQGQRSARVALRLAEAPNDFLSTVQIGITLIGILTGAVGGSGLAKALEPLIGAIDWLAPYRQGLSFAVVITLITFLSLLIGELVPKRIALADPERLACAAAPAMHWLARCSAPVVSLLSRSTDAVLRLLGVPRGREQAVSEEEIRALLREGAQTGVFEEAEHDMMQRVMRLADRPIKTLMTPRTEINWLDLEEPLERNLAEVMASNHSQFPVARGSLDDCQGVVRVRHLLAARMREEPLDLERMMQPPLFVAESARALSVLEEFRRSGIHLALVSDEYGGVAGLVTLNDLMEGIVGDLPSLEDQEEPQVTQREDGSWLVDGGLDLQTVNELIGHEIFDLERERRYHTIAGYVLHVLERIPREAEGFSRHGHRFEVIDMDANRIDKVLITPLPAEPGLP
jgi:putative hemolysin